MWFMKNERSSEGKSFLCTDPLSGVNLTGRLTSVARILNEATARWLQINGPAVEQRQDKQPGSQVELLVQEIVNELVQHLREASEALGKALEARQSGDPMQEATWYCSVLKALNRMAWVLAVEGGYRPPSFFLFYRGSVVPRIPDLLTAGIAVGCTALRGVHDLLGVIGESGGSSGKEGVSENLYACLESIANGLEMTVLALRYQYAGLRGLHLL